MKDYLSLLSLILETGEDRHDRTGVGTKSLFGSQLRIDLEKGFPLLTTKRVHFHSVVHELLWFLKGDTNIGYLQENGVKIWNEWADENGDLGPVYGKQWRDVSGIDQMRQVLETLQTDPQSRRMLVCAWNVAQIPQMRLPPCHCLFQFYAGDHDRLSLHLYQRSADIFLGVPFNIASYALLVHMVAHVTHRKPKDLIISFGDVHLYKNHIQQAKTQLSRVPLPLPTLSCNPACQDLFDFRLSDIRLEHYTHHEALPAPVAI